MQKLTENALTVLSKRYFKKDEKENIIEDWEQLCDRVAVALVINEKKELRNEWKAKYKKVMLDLDFLPNSPALKHLGANENSCSSACFVLPIEDSRDSIFTTLKHAVDVQAHGGGCISAGSLIPTSLGLKPIEEIEVGDIVWGVNEKNNDFTQASVTETHKYDPEGKNIAKVDLYGGTSLTLTDWHPFMILTENGIEERRTDELKLGDLIISGGQEHVWENDDFYWLLGLIVSDGSLDDSINGSRLRICKSNEPVIKRAAKIIGCNYNLSTDKRYNVEVWELSKVGKYIDDTFSSLFKYDGKWKKAHNVKIPKIVWESNYGQKCSFVAGLFDGDSYFNISKNRIEHSTVSKQLHFELSHIAAILGIRTSERIRRSKDLTERDSNELCFANLYGTVNTILKYTSRMSQYSDTLLRSNASKFPYNAFSNIVFENCLFDKRKPKRVEIGGKAFSLTNWYHTKKTGGKLSRSTSMYLLNTIKNDNDIWNIWKKYLGGAREVVNIEWGKNVKLHDLTVENCSTYLAASEGAPVVIHNTGFSFNKLRPNGDKIKSTGGFSSGPVSFMKSFNYVIGKTIRQSGLREGANMGVMNCDHPDIFEFINAKKEEGELTHFNISVGITDNFINAVKDDSDWNLVFGGKVHKTIKAMDLWNEIVTCAWSSADPGLLFLDTVNRNNPLNFYGDIESTNPCGEQPLFPYSSCILGSINLSNMLEGDWTKQPATIDWGKLQDTVRTSVRLLDSIIDVNKYPVDQIAEMTQKTRNIGLGIMGLADLLIKMHVKYGSDESVRIAEAIMSSIKSCSYGESEKLANEKGIAPIFEGRTEHRRNGTLNTIAPTGTLSLIANCSSGCEPIFLMEYNKSCIEGNITVKNPLMEEWEYGCFGKDSLPDFFTTAMDIPFEEHIKMQSVLQKSVDTGISKTINMKKSATKQDISKAYMMAWGEGCKGITVYRDGCKETQALTAIPHPAKKNKKIHSKILDGILKGSTIRIPYQKKWYLTMNFSDNVPVEVFINASKSGTDEKAWTEAVGRLISLYLQGGGDINKIVKTLKDINGESTKFSQGWVIKSGADAVAQAIEKLVEDDSGEPRKKLSGVSKCKHCGKMTFVREGGCASCIDPECNGFGKCG